MRDRNLSYKTFCRISRVGMLSLRRPTYARALSKDKKYSRSPKGDQKVTHSARGGFQSSMQIAFQKLCRVSRLGKCTMRDPAVHIPLKLKLKRRHQSVHRGLRYRACVCDCKFLRNLCTEGYQRGEPNMSSKHLLCRISRVSMSSLARLPSCWHRR